MTRPENIRKIWEKLGGKRNGLKDETSKESKLIVIPLQGYVLRPKI